MCSPNRYRWHLTILDISARSSGFLTLQDFWIVLPFKYYDHERTWWKLLQKHVVRTKFDLYVFIRMQIDVKQQINNQQRVDLVMFLIPIRFCRWLLLCQDIREDHRRRCHLSKYVLISLVRYPCSEYLTNNGFDFSGSIKPLAGVIA
jgi:hypothetical protein